MMNSSPKRIFGYDFARGLAIIGMIFVNFKVVMVAESSGALYSLVDILSGKAAALFVVLAGVGMTLMYESAKRKNDAYSIKQVKYKLLKRAAFLFIIGLSYYFIWPADILHYYGLFLSIGILLMPLSRLWLQIISILIVAGYYVSFNFFDYEMGWDWNSLEYFDFFTIEGFSRNLFFNGFHPVFPWLAFLLTGIWIGRLNFRNVKIRNRVMLISLITYTVFKGISVLLVKKFTKLAPFEAIDTELIFGTSPMPPLFFYMITASSLAVFIICLSVYITEKYPNHILIKQIVSTGQLALSNYFFHVIIGMIAIQLFFGKLEQAFSIEFAVAYAAIFSFLIIVFSHFWKKRFTHGPLEYLMRKVTG